MSSPGCVKYTGRSVVGLFPPQICNAKTGPSCSTILNSPTLPCAIKSPTCGSIFDPQGLRSQLAAIESKLSDASLWSDPKLSQPIMRDRKRLEKRCSLTRTNSSAARATSRATSSWPVKARPSSPSSPPRSPVLLTSAKNYETRTLLSGETDPPQRHRHRTPRRRWHREPGLGRDAHAHVSALGRTAKASRPR